MSDRAAWDRLVKAARTIVRQADDPKSGVIGHNAVLELHRALKACVPELRRQEMDVNGGIRGNESESAEVPQCG